MSLLTRSHANLSPDCHKIVNVASVPQRSPFRYAGGKSWLIPQIRRWLMSRATKFERFVEPFAGGASVGLEVGMSGLVPVVELVELDPDVAAVWQVIFSHDAPSLAKAILNVELDAANVRRITASVPKTQLERAFRTVVRNRVLHGGILAPGASVMKAGENGKGLRSRWYPETLARRILSLYGCRDRFVARCADGFMRLEALGSDKYVAHFVDPPYVKAGSRLYTYHQIDHERLFSTCARLQGDVLMTYDDQEEIHELARRCGFQVCRIPMKSRQHTVKHELLISRDLSWVSGEPSRPEARPNSIFEH